MITHSPTLPHTPPETVTVAPITQYVPFNINDNVTFYCEVVGTELIWEFAGRQIPRLLHAINVYIEDGLGRGEVGNIRRNSTLLVTVTESDIDKNNSEVSCFVPEMAQNKTFVYLRTFGKSF